MSVSSHVQALPAQRAAGRPAREARRGGLGTALLLAPGAAWMALFLVAPMLMMVYVSYSSGHWCK